MNTKQLRQKILDLAIKGKLVPQDPNDEPASKLIERIREEKEQLIKEGKLKRDKNESYIFVSDDKLHYEKFADGSVVCIEEEIPFEIPESWAWCRLKEVCIYIQRGKSPKYSEMEKYPVISQKCIRWSGLDLKPAKYITEDSLKNYEEVRFLCENDILWNSTGTGTVGRAAIYHNNLNPFSVAVADSHVTVIRPMNVCSLYIHNFIMSPYVQVGFEDLCDGSTNQKELSLTTVSEFLIPLPPVDEQKRISETVETLLELVDSIESDKIDLSELIKQTKAKVLDLAIKGKLVPQDPNDEPADKLLEKIREEKEKLIKEGKLKRDKNETLIFKNSDDNSYYEQIDGETVCIDDDLPFEIPDSWRWTKFANICEIARGGSPRPIEAYLTNAENGINWIKIGDTEKGGKYIYSTKEKIKPEGISKSRYVKAGDFLLTNSMSFGRPYILKTDGCIHDGWLVINDDFKVFDQNFLYYLLSSNVMYQLLSIAAQGSTVKNLKSYTVKNVIIPIPPKREQSQIASRIASIFSQLDTMQEIFLQ